MNAERLKLTVLLLTLTACGAMLAARGTAARGGSSLDEALGAALEQHGFKGRVGQSLEKRLGRIRRRAARPLRARAEERVE